jgi:uncharacterized membrane protein
MPDTQINQSAPADSMVTKLLEADAELATTEATLTAQLRTIQEKRHSLQTVINLFSNENISLDQPVAAVIADIATSLTPDAELPELESVEVEEDIEAVEVEEDAEPVAVEEIAVAELAPNMTEAPSAEAQPAKRRGKRGGRKSTENQQAKKTTKSTSKKEKGERSQWWQQYLRAEFDKTSLPDVVSKVLHRQPDTVLEIPDIVDKAFVDEMPKDARSKVGNRVSTILSTGVKDNKWYRARTGQYSLSRSAAEASFVS